MNPIEKLLAWFPRSDFMVLRHGYSANGRDYEVDVQTNMGKDPGIHRLVFTHTVRSAISTACGEYTWNESWSEEYSSVENWTKAGEPDGFVWGMWPPLAYPGLIEHEDSDEAADWSKRLNREMFGVYLCTDLFLAELVFHDISTSKLSDDTSLTSKVVIQLKGKRKKPE